MAEQKSKPIVFDPNKSYAWDENLEVKITGIEFDRFFKALQANLQDNLFQAHILQYEALRVAQDVLKRNVEDGSIKEVPQEKAPVKAPRKK